MNRHGSNRRVCEQLAAFSGTNPDDWHLCLRARFGMQLVLDAIREQKGAGHIVTTPYTCITAINPILASGHTPHYLDIDQKTLAPQYITACKFTDQVRAFIMQNTLGIITNDISYRAYADQQHAVLIEDSAHCLGRLAHNQDGQPLADISLHSFGAEKILPGTKFGAALYINPNFAAREPGLTKLILKKIQALPQPNIALNLRIRAYRYQNALIQHLPQSIRSNLRQTLAKLKLLEPSIHPYEQSGKQAKACATNRFVERAMSRNLETLTANYAKRSQNVTSYNQQLDSNLFDKITDQNISLLAYPIIFHSPDYASDAYSQLEQAGYFVRKWYKPLLYPGPNSAEQYSFDPSEFPTAQYVSERILCLPTDLSESATAKIISILNQLNQNISRGE